MADYDVFISYSRVDTTFVRALEAAFKGHQRAAWVDWQGIDYSTKWWDEICAGIEGSHHFVLVVSPDSLNSVYCQREIGHARRQGKHIIPLLYRPIDEVELVGGWYTSDEMKPVEDLARENWEAIKTIQWIQHEKLGSDIAVTLMALEETIDRDPACIEAHTQLLLQMQTWQSSGRSPSALLSGDILSMVEERLTTCVDKVTFTKEQREFVTTSRSAEDARTRQIADDNRRTQRLRWTALTAAIIGLLALLATGGAVSQMVNARNTAATAQAEVVDAQVDAQIEATRIGIDVMNSEAQLQANRAQVALANGNRQAALGFALESLRNYPTVLRSESSLALSMALSTQGREIFNLQYPTPLKQAIWNAHQTQILAQGQDGNAEVFDIATGKALFALRPANPLLTYLSNGEGAAWNANGTRIFTLSDFAVYIWDASNGTQLLTLTHPTQIEGAHWNRAGTQVLTWGVGSAWLWDTETGKLLLTLNHGETVIANAVWNPDETRILTWASDSTLRIWDVASGMQQIMMQHEDVVKTDSGTLVNTILGAAWNAEGTQVLSWSTDKTARVWDAKTGDLLLTLTHPDIVLSAAWKPSDESQILTVSETAAQVWDAKSGKQVLSLSHNGTVIGAEWSAGGDSILTRENDEAVRIWQATDGTLLTTLQHSTHSHEDAIAPPTFGATQSEDNRTILTWGKDLVRLWRGDKLLMSLPFQTKAADPYNQIDIGGARIDRNAQHILAWTKDGAIRVWSTDSSANVLMFDAKTASDGAIWSKDYQHILTWSSKKGGGATIYEAATGKQLLHIATSDSIYEAKWSPDETHILTRNLNNGVVNVWDVSIGNAHIEQIVSKAQLSLPHDDLKTPNVIGAAFSPDGRRIATWTSVGLVRVWNATTGAMIAQMGEDIPQPQSFTSAPLGAVWSIDSQRLLHWTDDKVLHIWDTTTGKSLLDLHHDNLIVGAVWSHDEKHILSWSLDGTVRLWNATNGIGVFAPIFVGTDQTVGVVDHDFAQSAAWNKDETRILVATGGGNVEIYDAMSGQLQVRFGKRNGRVLGAVWSPDESRVLSWSDDGSVEIGDIATGTTSVRVIHSATVQGATWSADGKRFLTWAWDNTARIWDAANGAPLIVLQHLGWVLSASWDKAETHLLTWASGDTTRIWDVTLEGMIAAAQKELDTSQHIKLGS